MSRSDDRMKVGLTRLETEKSVGTDWVTFESMVHSMGARIYKLVFLIRKMLKIRRLMLILIHDSFFLKRDSSESLLDNWLDEISTLKHWKWQITDQNFRCGSGIFPEYSGNFPETYRNLQILFRKDSGIFPEYSRNLPEFEREQTQ